MRFSLVIHLVFELPKCFNMSQRYYLALLFLVAVGSWSCRVESLDDPIIIPLVDQEFSFQMWQNLSSDNPFPLEIRMYTIEDYGCLNTTILTSFSRSGRNLEFTLFDILDPEVCDEGLAPATATESLYDIQQDLYRLKIELQDVVSNEGWLTVDDNSYVISMDEESGISWDHYEMQRIPENALWGYISYPDATAQLQAEAFITELEAISATSMLEDGYYGHFSLTDSGTKLEVNTTTVPAQTVMFVLEHDGPRLEIDQQVEAFLTETNPEVKLHIWNGKGNEWEN